MAFSYGFFDARERDRVYTAENFTQYLSSLICNGILDTYGQCFSVTAHNSLTVTIGTGKAWIGGHYFNNDAPYSLDLSQYVSSSGTQYVSIGICCDTSESERRCSLVVSAQHGPMAFTSLGSRTYLTIAIVRLVAGVSMITSTDITDCRDDESKCGYVKCILGKCGISGLLDRLEELERRAENLESIYGHIFNATGIINMSNVFVGSPAPLDPVGASSNGLICVVGSLDGVEKKEEDT